MSPGNLARTALLTAALTTAGAGVAHATTVPGCAPPAAGGDWPYYSGPLAAPGAPGGNRDQPAEQTITPANASSLGLAWKLPTPDGGLIHDTPVISDGCVFFGTDLGTVVAVNADTGKVVWIQKLGSGGGSNPFVGAGIVGSPAVANGLVYVGVTTPSASIEGALDETTGQVVWSTPLDHDPGGSADASPVPFNGMVFQAYENSDSTTHSNPGWAILDGSRDGGGKILVATKTIPAADYAAGARGASVVETAAVDLDQQVIYAGTGNPASEYRTKVSDALLKIDANPNDATFGQILASHQGDSESYPLPQDETPPTCSPAAQWPASPFSCGQFDYDYLSSGDLFTNSHGEQLYGELQKSGVFHAVKTDTMQPAWDATLGAPCFGCNLGSTAADANGIYVAVTGGNLYALDNDTGAIKWVAPGTGSFHFNGVSVANGVVYDVNDLGALEAYNAADGTLLLAHPLATDNQQPTHDAENSSGLSIARNTIFLASQTPTGGSSLFAFRLGAPAATPPLPGLPDPPPVPNPGGGGPAQSIVTAAQAQSYGYATPVVVIRQGDGLNYSNLDTARHDVVSTEKGPDGAPLFSSGLAATGQTVAVTGLDHLKSGVTYHFYCSVHPNMQGQLIVQ
jgi:outer membrane protein assembly factor BamB/plastocyanin